MAALGAARRHEPRRLLVADGARRRVNRRGLAGACIEGVLSSSAPFVAVMDADLQHDPAALPSLVAPLDDRADRAEVVVETPDRLIGEEEAEAFERQQLDEEDADVMRRLLSYEEGTAGALLTPDIIILGATATVPI